MTRQNTPSDDSTPDFLKEKTPSPWKKRLVHGVSIAALGAAGAFAYSTLSKEEPVIVPSSSNTIVSQEASAPAPLSTTLSALDQATTTQHTSAEQSAPLPSSATFEDRMTYARNQSEARLEALADLCTLEGDWQWSSELENCSELTGSVTMLPGHGLEYTLKNKHGVPAEYLTRENLVNIQDMNMRNGKLDGVTDSLFVDYSGETGVWKKANDCDDCGDGLNDSWKADFVYDFALTPTGNVHFPLANASHDAEDCGCDDDVVQEVEEVQETPVIVEAPKVYLALDGTAPSDCLDEFVAANPGTLSVQESQEDAVPTFKTYFTLAGEEYHVFDFDADGVVDFIRSDSARHSFENVEVGTPLAQVFTTGQNALSTAYAAARADHLEQWNGACHAPALEDPEVIELPERNDNVVEVVTEEYTSPAPVPRPRPTPRPAAPATLECVAESLDNFDLSEDFRKGMRKAGLDDAVGNDRLVYSEGLFALINPIVGDTATAYIDSNSDGRIDARATADVDFDAGWLGIKRWDKDIDYKKTIERLFEADRIPLSGAAAQDAQRAYTAEVTRVRNDGRFEADCHTEPVVQTRPETRPEPRYESSSDAETSVSIGVTSGSTTIENTIMRPNGTVTEQDLAFDTPTFKIGADYRSENTLVEAQATFTQGTEDLGLGDAAQEFYSPFLGTLSGQGFTVNAERKLLGADNGGPYLGVGGGVSYVTIDSDVLPDQDNWFANAHLTFGISDADGYKGDFIEGFAGATAQSITEIDPFNNVQPTDVDNSIEWNPEVGFRFQNYFGHDDRWVARGLARYGWDVQQPFTTDEYELVEGSADYFNARGELGRVFGKNKDWEILLYGDFDANQNRFDFNERSTGLPAYLDSRFNQSEWGLMLRKEF